MSAEILSGAELRSHPIHFLLIPGFSMLGLLSAVEPFRVANQFQSEMFSWHFISANGEPVTASNGMSFEVEQEIEGLADLSTLVVCAGFEPEAAATPEMLDWLRSRAGEGTDMGGIDTGSVLLARAGLLKGFRATVHWEYLSSFQEDFLEVDVTGSLFEIDRKRFTSSGGTSSLDMMLQLISLSHGYDLAVKISEQFIHERIREPHDDQRMPVSLRLQIHHPKLIRIVEIMEQNLQDPLTVDDLASRVGLTARQLARLFRANLDQSPARFYLGLRLERARQLLRQTGMRVLDVALACGFASNAAFTRAYLKHFQRPPKAERQ